MSAALFPLVELRSVANAQNEWVALLLGGAGRPVDADFLQHLFGTPDLLVATAPLDCILLLDDAAVLTDDVLGLLPKNRAVLAVRGAALADTEEGARALRRLADLQAGGYRVMLDGPPAPGTRAPALLRTVSHDCAAPGAQTRLTPPPVLFGPHLARNIPTRAAFHACENAGYAWFSGDYVHEMALDDGDDGTSRKRMLAMLALLARDADSAELEAQLKQDTMLSYHLLKLVNSAAFSSGTPITSFNQAISRLGRRQLQRWLQLLLYARQRPDDLPNPLLALAAQRGAALEALARFDGADRDEQDLAFMAGVFSLLDRLFRMPMAAVVDELPLPGDVAAALVEHAGPLGRRLLLAESAAPTADALEGAGLDAAGWWQARLHACHWAIQVARNV
jgi:EAL and modified HD-GYP domain-containing signal transduction protein